MHIFQMLLFIVVLFSSHQHLPPPVLLFAIAMFLLRLSNVNLLLLSAIEVLFLLALT